MTLEQPHLLLRNIDNLTHWNIDVLCDGTSTISRGNIDNFALEQRHLCLFQNVVSLFQRKICR